MADKELLARALQAFHRGYAGDPGVSRPRRIGKTAAGVQAVINLLLVDTKPRPAAVPDGRKDEPDINDDPYGCGFENGVASVAAEVADAKRWRHVRELAWFVDEANRVYRDRFGEINPDWDEIQQEIDRDIMSTALGAACGGDPSVDETMTALCLVGEAEHITYVDVESWTAAQRSEAFAWAMAVHFRASDNDDVEVPERPKFTLASVPEAHRE